MGEGTKARGEIAAAVARPASTNRLLRRAAAALLSWFAPGSGHFLLGAWRRGLVFVAALVVAVLSIPFTEMTGLAAFVALRFAVIVDCLRLRSAPRPRWLPVIAGYALLFVLLLGGRSLMISCYLEAFTLESSGMAPNVLAKDHIIVDKFRRSPKRGDIALYRVPAEPDRYYAHRVVALGGDRVEILEGMLYLNGEPRQVGAVETCEFSSPNLEGEWTEERWACRLEHLGQNANHLVTYAESGWLSEFPVEGDGPFVVPDDSVFVLGDNRANSRDSRQFGPVPLDAIEGTANFVWWSHGADGIRWKRLGRKLR